LGEVHLALDLELHRQVALKRLQLRHADDEESCRRFLLEAEITGQLEHPGVVPVYGLQRDPEGQPSYAMRFIEGESFQDAIKRFHTSLPAGSRKLALRQLLSCFVAVCNTLAYAHSRGIIHRDLKPSNILLGKYGETLVVDWGLAKSLETPKREHEAEEKTETGSMEENLPLSSGTVGTLGFMSPEQAAGRGEAVGTASDIYSLGATLCTLLTGKRPIQRRSTPEESKEEPAGSRVSPNAISIDTPAALDAICRKAMAVNPADRYATALDMAADVEHWLGDEPVSAWREPWVVPVRRWLGRHRTLVTAAAAAVLVTAVGLAIGLVLLAKGKEREQLARREAETERDASRLNLYVSRMNLAQRAWEDSQADRMLELLEMQRPSEPGEKDLRGWEWYYLSGLCRCLPLSGHKSTVGGAAFSRDGKFLATASADGVVKVWDMATGHEIVTSKGYSEGFQGVAFAPGGRSLAAGSSDATIRILDPTTGLELRTIKGHSEPVNVVIFSRDGRHLFSASEDRSVRVWDVAGGRALLVMRGHNSAVRGLAMSPDERFLASASLDGTVKVWELPLTLRASPGEGAAGERVGVKGFDAAAEVTEAFCTIRADAERTSSVVFSPDGTRVVTAGWDRQLKIWKLPAVPPSPLMGEGTGVRAAGTTLTAPSLILNGHSAAIYALAFSPDGQRLASGGFDRTVRVWEVNSGQEVLSLKGHHESVRIVAFSPDGRYLVSSGDDGTARVWDATPLASEEEVQPKALSLVKRLFAQPLPRDEVIARLRQDTALGDPVRSRALTLATRYPEEPIALNNTAWPVVARPGGESAAYRLALHKAEAACRAFPDDGLLLNTLGVAQYRLGMYQECIDTLTRADKRNSVLFRGPFPSDTAFLAMASLQLGRNEKARQYLETLHEAMKRPRWTKAEEAVAFTREADKLFEDRPKQVGRPTPR
jgi:WD40 repeat protein/tRNA A-37 threonylcarbamoyl transferase component Bud32